MSRQAPLSATIPSRVTLTLLVLPPLIALALLAYATLAHRPRPVHTGDALLDTYLQALVDSKQALDAGGFAIDWRSVLPAAQWLEWQRAYGADPQFWLLGYYCGPQLQLDGPEGTVPGLKYLQLAQAHKATDWVVMLNLVRAKVAGWRSEARQALASAPPAADATLEPWMRELLSNASDISQQPDIWSEVRRRHGAELSALLDALGQVGAQQAMVHYYKAYLAVAGSALDTAATQQVAAIGAAFNVSAAELARYGTLQGMMRDYLPEMAVRNAEIEAAMAELAAGNAAAQAAPGLGLPYDPVASAAGQGAPLAGDEALTGLLALHYSQAAPANDIAFSQIIQTLVFSVKALPDLQGLQVLHQCCCRYGQCARTKDGLAEAINAEYHVLAAIKDSLPTGNRPRRQAVSQAQARLDQIDQTSVAVFSSRSYLLATPGIRERVLNYSPAFYCGGQYAKLDTLRDYGHEMIREQTTLAGPVRQQFEALAALDFTR